MANKIARRAFLFGSAALGGGIAFGGYLALRPLGNPLEEGLRDGEVTFNPWVKITPEAVFVIAHHTDVGQGVRTMQATLICEELDIAPEAVTVLPAEPALAYYTPEALEDLSPVNPRTTGPVAQIVRDSTGLVAKMFSLMTTGGSSSTSNSFVRLRLAGAVARETLVAAAARRTGLDRAVLTTRDGAVHLPDGTAIAYTDLAAEAAEIEPVTDVTLRPPSEWRLIGKPRQRLDVIAKSTGTLTYGIDVRMDGMVHAALRLNPNVGGALLSYDASAALAMRGVAQVIEVAGGLAVVADNTWRAFRAADALEVEWGPAPYPANSDAHWAAVTRTLDEGRNRQSGRDDGNVEAALAAAAPEAKVTAEYRAPYLPHAPMEPPSAIVRYDGDAATVWVATQVHSFTRDNVARILGLDADRVTLINQVAGGSFGHRLEDDTARRAAEIARAMPGVPVKLTLSREEDFRQSSSRQIAVARMEGSGRDGMIEALDLKVAMPSVSRAQSGRHRSAPPLLYPDPVITAGIIGEPFDIPNFRVTGYEVDPLAPVSSWRSVGASTNAFFMNSAFDEVVARAGGDPMLERLRLVDDPTSRAVLEAVAEMSGWGAPLAQGKGRGVAFCRSFGVPTAEVIEVTRTERGIKIDKVWVAVDSGLVVDPVNFDNQVVGGVLWGLGHAMHGELTYSDGAVNETNFDLFETLRIDQVPKVEVRALENNSRIRGIGEPPVPPAAPALAGAIYSATGQRLREMPFRNAVSFV